MNLIKISELFDIEYGNQLDLNKLKISKKPDSINFVSRTSKNNGVEETVEKIHNLSPYPSSLITVTLGGTFLLSAFVQIRSEELKIEPSVLADRKRINSFVTHFEQKRNMSENFLLQDWRKEYIGEPMLRLLKGEVGLKINQSGKVTLIPIE